MAELCSARLQGIYGLALCPPFEGKGKEKAQFFKKSSMGKFWVAAKFVHKVKLVCQSLILIANYIVSGIILNVKERYPNYAIKIWKGCQA